MLRVVIIDDEDHIRDSLVKILARHCPQVMVAGAAFSVESGAKAIREFHPDLVLLDIQMNDGTGFDLLQSFSRSFLSLPTTSMPYRHSAFQPWIIS
jgi:two-component system LytT family response regulator